MSNDYYFMLMVLPYTLCFPILFGLLKYKYQVSDDVLTMYLYGLFLIFVIILICIWFFYGNRMISYYRTYLKLNDKTLIEWKYVDFVLGAIFRKKIEFYFGNRSRGFATNFAFTIMITDPKYGDLVNNSVRSFDFPRDVLNSNTLLDKRDHDACKNYITQYFADHNLHKTRIAIDLQTSELIYLDSPLFGSMDRDSAFNLGRSHYLDKFYWDLLLIITVSIWLGFNLCLIFIVLKYMFYS